MTAKRILGAMAFVAFAGAACDDTPEPAGVTVPNPLIATLEVEALPQYAGASAGGSIDITVAIHNPTQVPVRIDSPLECLVTAVNVAWGPSDDLEDVPLIGTGDVACAAAGATIVFPGDTLFVTHTLTGWRLDDTVEPLPL